MIVKDWIEGHTGQHLEEVDADLGIEIEVEGVNLPARVGESWRVDRDGSLRGESYEYVSKPIKYSELTSTLDQLKDAYRRSDSVVNCAKSLAGLILNSRAMPSTCTAPSFTGSGAFLVPETRP